MSLTYISSRFLLAHLHAEHLAQQTNTAALLDVAKNLPEKVTKTYVSSLERIREQDENIKQLAFHALSWVLHALRPLTPVELKYALVINLEHMATEYDLTMEETIVSSCVGLILVDRTENWMGDEVVTVNFLHRTVHDFLKVVSVNSTDFLSGLQIAVQTMKVVSFPGMHSEYPFIDYATTAWGSLVHKYEQSAEEVLELALSQLQQSTTIAVLGDDHLSTDGTGSLTAIHLIAESDLPKTCEEFLKLHDEDTIDSVINRPDRRGRTALDWAVRAGRQDIVEQLLAVRNIDVNTKDAKYGHTPLLRAVRKGHSQIVQNLLDHSQIDVDSKDSWDRTALSWAAQQGYSQIVSNLLRYDADVDSTDGNGRTPLSWAAQYGHLEIVSYLLLYDADVNSVDEDGRTPLSWAAQHGHLEVVQELLRDEDADADIQDENGLTPLSYAQKNGHSGILLVLGPSPGSRGNSPG